MRSRSARTGKGHARQAEEGVKVAADLTNDAPAPEVKSADGAGAAPNENMMMIAAIGPEDDVPATGKAAVGPLTTGSGGGANVLTMLQLMQQQQHQHQQHHQNHQHHQHQHHQHQHHQHQHHRQSLAASSLHSGAADPFGFPPMPASTTTAAAVFAADAAALEIHMRRRKTKVACQQCVNAKACCDDSRPCRRCVKHGCEDKCVDRERTPRKAGPRKPKIARPISRGISDRGPRTSCSCVPCSKMKVKCDDARPCSRCVKLKRAHLCVDRVKKRKRRELGVCAEFNPDEAMARIQPAIISGSFQGMPMSAADLANAATFAQFYGIADPSSIMASASTLASNAVKSGTPAVPFASFDAGQVVQTTHFDAPLLPQELRVFLMTAWERYPIALLRERLTAPDRRIEGMVQTFRECLSAEDVSTMIHYMVNAVRSASELDRNLEYKLPASNLLVESVDVDTEDSSSATPSLSEDENLHRNGRNIDVAVVNSVFSFDNDVCSMRHCFGKSARELFGYSEEEIRRLSNSFGTAQESKGAQVPFIWRLCHMSDWPKLAKFYLDSFLQGPHTCHLQVQIVDKHNNCIDCFACFRFTFDDETELPASCTCAFIPKRDL